ncbi:NADP-dependent alcohol dehydrogenase [Saccharomycopsis crataegensis]|uniref:NADP-dependent alcohol dehydrogenase n=1 Tax=Saccharomycopsis crataegensis TaxID=43959 RepID=A0AAV5QNL2_9ASCO|nr:NADP-dependent alcohol dehydrogenase [Saccharomycopsis crataegensis]
MAKYPEKFTGFGVLNHEEWNHPKKVEFDPKPWGDHEIDIQIETCGVCGSDVHCAHGSWGETYSPIIVGHEIVGKVLKVGSQVENIKVGDRVGVGAQCSSCGECDLCQNGNEQYCVSCAWTYAGNIGEWNTQGGYASHIRVLDRFAFVIPEKLESKYASPLLCGGLTVYSPLVRNGCGPGKKVAISGLGGLGHQAVMIAKALGAHVTVISRSDSKKEDSFKMGADQYIATNEKGWAAKHAGEFNLILNCGSSLSGIDMQSMLAVLTSADGRFASISAPPITEMCSFSPFSLMGKSISQHALGNAKEMRDLLQLCADKDIKPWIEEIPISEQGTHEALTRADNGDVRYRFVLTDFEKEFKDAY